VSIKRKDSPIIGWGRAKIMEVFGADLRSLAVFRIALAIMVLIDLSNRATDLSAHYTDRGVLPRSILLQDVLNRWSFSLNLMHGELFFQALLFGILALVALALLVGYRTRLVTFAAWMLLLSIQWRNPLVLNAGDTLLRMLLFWSMLLPLGAHWSVDQSLKVATPRLSMRFLSLATVGLFLQIAFVYWFTAALKSSPEWREDGTAIYYALSNAEWTTPIGSYLLHISPPLLLEMLTFATLALEAFGPFLLFCPILTGPIRTGTVLAFMSLHVGIWLTMDIGTFPWVSAFCVICFLPSWFWDKSVAMLSAVLPRLHDTARHLEYTAVRLAHTYWLPLRARLSTMLVSRSSIVSVAAHGDEQPKHLAERTTASAERETPHGAAAGSEPIVLRSSLVVNILAVFFLIYIFCWNLTTVSAFTMPERAVPLGSFLGLKQAWGMFAPSPDKSGGWYVVPGTLRSGQQVDLMANIAHDDFSLREGVSWERPQDVASTFKNKHWRKYLKEIRQEDNADLRRYFGRYICRQWNARNTGADQLVNLEIAYMEETTRPNYQRTTPEKRVLREHSCS
jgi:hypothetical protein